MKSRFLLLLLLCLCVLRVNAGPLTGSELSLAVEKIILKAGLTPSRIPLAITGQDLFPYNLTVDFPATSGTDSKENKLLFAFTQEDVLEEEAFFADFLRELAKIQHHENITVLCTAGDRGLAGLSSVHTGTAEFADVVKEFETPAVIILSLGSAWRLYTGSYRRTSPRYLTQAVVNALYAKKAAFHLATAVTSFYRLGFIQADRRMEACMRASFPTIQLIMPRHTDFSLLTHIAAHYPSAEESAIWDGHYLLLPLIYPLKAIIIGEQFFVIAALILGALSILMLCAFTFSGSDARRQKRRFLQSWFMLPLTLAILFAAILGGQALVSHIGLLGESTALIKLGCKILVTLILVSLLFALQELLHAPVGLFIYSELPLFIAACNIFIFSAIDIQFFLPLLVEYAIIYYRRKTDQALKLILTLFLMLIPFCPYIYTIMANGKEEAVNLLIFCSRGVNFLLALLFFPFQIIWLRILFAFNLYRRSRKKLMKKTLFHNVLSLSVIFSVTALIIVILSLVSLKLTPEKEQKASIIHRDRNTVHMSLSRTRFADLTTEHVTISSDIPALRYELTLEAEDDKVPLYDASYAFSLSSDASRARFDIPDFPPAKITIDYAFSSEITGRLTLTALYATATKGVYRQETRLVQVQGSERL